MKKTMKQIFFVIAILFLSIAATGRVEAAWVAVVPIQVDDTKVERAGDFNNYYWDVIVNRFKYPDYELMDDEKVVVAVPEKGLPSYDLSVLASVAQQIDADIVIAMRLDSVKEMTGSMFASEPMTECEMDGEFASYNRLTGKYYHNKMRERNSYESVLLLKSDWQYEVFNAELNRYINRTLEDKNNKLSTKNEINRKESRQEEKR